MARRGKEDLNLKLQCTDCRDEIPNIVEDFSAVCGNCGLVLGNRIIDTRSEWRTFANSDDNSGDPSRVGASTDPLLGGNNVLETTVISGIDNFSGMSKDLNRAQNRMNHDTSLDVLRKSFQSIEDLGNSIMLPRVVIDTAKQFFKQSQENKIQHQTKLLDAMKAACLYLACKSNQVERTLKEISKLTKVGKSDIGKCLHQLKSLIPETNEQISLEATLRRFASQLEMHPRLEQASVQSLIMAVWLEGRHSLLVLHFQLTPVAGVCLYMALLEHPEIKTLVTAKDIAKTVQCAESTIKSNIKTVREAISPESPVDAAKVAV